MSTTTCNTGRFPPRAGEGLCGIAGIALLLGACATPPKGPVTQLTPPATPISRDAIPVNGAIYQSLSNRTFFEDRRAHHVGDVITINIVEKAVASKEASTSTGRKSSIDNQIDTLLGLPTTTRPFGLTGGVGLNANVSASGDSSFEGKGSSAQNNSFISTITTTVTEVLPNGNLVVSGEKLVQINQGEEYIRFAGTVRPESVGADNTVLSSQVANARIEYRGSGSIDDNQRMGWLQRAFVQVWPF